MFVIEISHLTKRYGEHVAVSDLSLNIEPGKIYGFLGPNGAGKSTTMNIITGYIGATEGTVKINGYDILKQPEEAKKCIGYLPEMPPLYTDMTVGEYLRFAAELKKIPKAKRLSFIEEAMELTRIADVKNRLIRNLSKGYRQRVGFAQAVLGYPEVIILDEPTVGLDPKQIIEIRELIQSLGRRHTVILSSHILSEVKEVCEHIFIISNGRLVASDTTENLINRMSGEQELRLLLKGAADAVSSVLQEAGFSGFSVAQSSEGGCCQAVVKTEHGDDIRERVFFAFANAALPILDMHTGGRSLEEIFLELTDQGAFSDRNIGTDQPNGTDQEYAAEGNRDKETADTDNTGETVKGSDAKHASEAVQEAGTGNTGETVKGSDTKHASKMVQEAGTGNAGETAKGSDIERESETAQEAGTGNTGETVKGLDTKHASETVQEAGTENTGKTAKGSDIEQESVSAQEAGTGDTDESGTAYTADSEHVDAAKEENKDQSVDDNRQEAD